MAGPGDHLDLGFADHVRAAVAEVWFRNAGVVAWLRVGIRALILPVYGVALVQGVRTTGIAPATGAALSAAHLAIGIAIVLWLRARASVLAIALGAASDLLFMSASAFLNTNRMDASLLLAMTALVVQLLLLVDALTLSRRLLLPYVAWGWLVLLGLTWRCRLDLSDALVILVIVAAFSLATVLTGARVVQLTAKASVEALDAEAARHRRDELQAAHDALRAAQAEAEALSRLVVHDLRNPLASIWANLEEAGAAISPDQRSAQEALEIAVSELRRLAAMTGDLLVITRLERQDWDTRAPADVGALLAEVARSARAVVARAGGSLTVNMDGAPAVAALDAPLVRRLLDNLLANAARHVRPGDRVELAAEPDGRGLRLAVRNTGPPVPPEARARLFERNATVGQARWEHFGLGLYLCRLVAERHGGAIALVDRPGWGVSFEVTLPAPGVAAGAVAAS